MPIGMPHMGDDTVVVGVGEIALDRLSDSDANPNSVFTRSFLPLLENPDNSLIAVAKQTRAAVKQLANSIGQTQSPAYYDEIVGDEPVATFDEIEHALRLANAALPREEEPHAKDVGQ